MTKSARPQCHTQTTFEPNDRDGFDPSRSLQHFGDQGVVESATLSDAAQARFANGATEVECNQAQGFGVRVGAGDLGPVDTEGARGFASRSGHGVSLGESAGESDASVSGPLEVLSTFANGDSYIHDGEDWARTLRKIDQFTPKIDSVVWAAIGDFVRSAIHDAGPEHYKTAQPWLSATAQFVAWSVHEECLPLERDVIFAPANIYAFVAQRDGRSDAAQGTIRSILLRISARLIGEHEGASEDRRSYNASVGHRPYTLSEKRGLRSYVEGQATEYRRDNLRVVVAFAAGAGLTAVDMLALSPSDVEDRGDLVLVHVPGKKARTVPVLSEWEDLARSALVKADPAAPLVLQNNVKYRSGTQSQTSCVARTASA